VLVIVHVIASPSTSAATFPGRLSIGHLSSPPTDTNSYPSSPTSSSAGVSPASNVIVSPEFTASPPIDNPNESRSAAPSCRALIRVTVGAGSGLMSLALMLQTLRPHVS
jgi:hypothetical protein